MNEVIHGDCLIESEQIASGSVDLILTDPPYGNMDTDGGRRLGINGWDLPIEPKDIYTIANRILRKNGKMILFAQEPYTTKLIGEAIPNLPFSYRGIWEKDTFGNSLGVNKNWVGLFEDILVFSKSMRNEDIQHPVKEYIYKKMNDSGLVYSDTKVLNCLVESGCTDTNKKAKSVAGHKFDYKTKQYEFLTETQYDALIGLLGWCKSYTELNQMHNKWKIDFPATFNLWEGKKYKSNILKYAKDYDGYHPTQKPVLLLEDLIKTFSNEGDLVVDLTAGSGSTAIACINTKRWYIVIEKEQKYIDIINKRIAEHEKQISFV